MRTTRKCPYCGRLVDFLGSKFRLHNVTPDAYRSETCPLSNQRGPITGLSFEAHEERAKLLADLAAQVQDADPSVVWQYLTCLDGAELQRLLMFALAALPIDQTVTDMWGWCAQLPVARLEAV